MAVVIKESTYFTKGTPFQYTLDKDALAAITSVDNSPYFKIQTNWQHVAVRMKSVTGNQYFLVKFDATQANPTGFMSSSVKVFDDFIVDHIFISDYDRGRHKIEREELVTAEFDVSVAP